MAHGSVLILNYDHSRFIHSGGPQRSLQTCRSALALVVDGRRSVASLRARSGAVGDTHSTGSRGPSACPSGGAGGLPCFLLLLRTCNSTTGAPTDTISGTVNRIRLPSLTWNSLRESRRGLRRRSSRLL